MNRTIASGGVAVALCVTLACSGASPVQGPSPTTSPASQTDAPIQASDELPAAAPNDTGDQAPGPVLVTEVQDDGTRKGTYFLQGVKVAEIMADADNFPTGTWTWWARDGTLIEAVEMGRDGPINRTTRPLTLHRFHGPLA